MGSILRKKILLFTGLLITFFAAFFFKDFLADLIEPVTVHADYVDGGGGGPGCAGTGGAGAGAGDGSCGCCSGTS